jgi:hypothetical protein
MADNHGFLERRRANREIHIERSRRSPLPLIFGVALLLVLMVVVWPDDGATGVGTPMPDAGGSVVSDSEMRAADVDAAIEDYVRFVADRRARDAIGPKHEYTAEGIRRLAGAISAVAARDSVAVGALEPRVQTLRERADALQRDPSARTHALKTREAFLLAASVLESIQDRRFRNLDGEATAVLRAAEDVKARTPLMGQADAVQRFFDRAANLLRAMRSG